MNTTKVIHTKPLIEMAMYPESCHSAALNLVCACGRDRERDREIQREKEREGESG